MIAFNNLSGASNTLLRSCGFSLSVFFLSMKAFASDGKQPFVEFSNARQVVTFDLRTVHLIQPGKFTINSTSIDTADYMRNRLNALDIMKDHCSRSEGFYNVDDGKLLGKPDHPLKPVQVKNRSDTDSLGRTSISKMIEWELPYSRFRDRGAITQTYSCKYDDESEASTYISQRSMITNGSSSSMTFDCRRQLVDMGGTGRYLMKPPLGSYAFGYYMRVCEAVTNENPFISEN